MNVRKMGIVVLVATILGIMAAVGWQEWKEVQESKQEEKTDILQEEKWQEEPEVLQIQTIVYPKEEIVDKYKGYAVAAKLEILAIRLETYILEKCTKNSLNKAVAKFWGTNPNEIGNCSVAGHNAPRNKNMFYHLKNLEIGDELTVSDRKVGKVPYEIYRKYTVLPDDVSPLDADMRRKKRDYPHYLYEQFVQKINCESKRKEFVT